MQALTYPTCTLAEFRVVFLFLFLSSSTPTVSCKYTESLLFSALAVILMSGLQHHFPRKYATTDPLSLCAGCLIVYSILIIKLVVFYL